MIASAYWIRGWRTAVWVRTCSGPFSLSFPIRNSNLSSNEMPSPFLSRTVPTRCVCVCPFPPLLCVSHRTERPADDMKMTLFLDFFPPTLHFRAQIVNIRCIKRLILCLLTFSFQLIYICDTIDPRQLIKNFFFLQRLWGFVIKLAVKGNQAEGILSNFEYGLYRSILSSKGLQIFSFSYFFFGWLIDTRRRSDWPRTVCVCGKRLRVRRMAGCHYKTIKAKRLHH